MPYETKRLLARRMTQADLPNLARTLQDPQAMYAYAHAFSDEEVAAWLANQQRRYQEDGFGLCALINKADGQFIGQCGLTIQTWAKQPVIEVGYLLERRCWHQGFAIEAARGAKAYAFEHLGATGVWSIIRDNNLASMNVAIRNKMLIRGKQIKHYYGLDMPHFGFYVARDSFVR